MSRDEALARFSIEQKTKLHRLLSAARQFGMSEELEKTLLNSVTNDIAFFLKTTKINTIKEPI